MSNSLTDGGCSVVSDLVSFDDADGDGSLVSSVGLLSAVVSSATLAKKRVPPDLSLSSAAAKSAMLSCRANDDDADKVVLCVGRVNPHDELMSSAEADKNSAADAEGLEEAVIAAIISLLIVLLPLDPVAYHYTMFMVKREKQMTRPTRR